MNSNTVAISIIVPIYNAGEFLKDTIESIISQSFLDFELLLINDGSNDNSKFICEEFSAIDKRVKIINKENGGVSSARNVGLKNAVGDYILHVDADDMLLPEALHNLYNNAIENNSDIVIANYIVKYASVEKIIKQKTSNSSEDFLIGILVGDYHAGLWNKLIKKNCYTNLSFDENINYMEDKLILTRILLNKPYITFLDFEVYEYIQRESSITNKLSEKTILNIEKVILKIESLLNFDKKFNYSLYTLKLNFKIQLLINSQGKKELIDKFKEVNDKVLFNNYISLHHRVLLWFEFHNISIFTRIFKLIK